MDLCKFKNMFGKVGHGIHSYRCLNIAIVDLILTIVLAYLVSDIMKLKLLYTLFGTVLLGIILHRLFCVFPPLSFIFGAIYLNSLTFQSGTERTIDLDIV